MLRTLKISVMSYIIDDIIKNEGIYLVIMLEPFDIRNVSNISAKYPVISIVACDME